jgi:hypothetical protein
VPEPTREDTLRNLSAAAHYEVRWNTFWGASRVKRFGPGRRKRAKAATLARDLARGLTVGVFEQVLPGRRLISRWG